MNSEAKYTEKLNLEMNTMKKVRGLNWVGLKVQKPTGGPAIRPDRAPFLPFLPSPAWARGPAANGWAADPAHPAPPPGRTDLSRWIESDGAASVLGVYKSPRGWNP